MSHEPRCTIDFESRSECPIKTSGSWKYSLDPTTEVLCMAFRMPYWEPGRTGLWHPAFPHLDIPEGEDFNDLAELFEWMMAEGLVEAHGVFFELGIWVNQMVARCGWPVLDLRQWRCSAAKAATHTLPRALEDAVDNLDLPVSKDMEGSKVMKKMAKPRKAIATDIQAWNRQHAPCPVCRGLGKVQEVKKDGTPKVNLSKCQVCNGRGHTMALQHVPLMPVLYHESREMMEMLWTYCRQDVLAEEALSQALPDLTNHELDIFHMDLAVNQRGFQLDPLALDAATVLIDEECVDLNAELKVLTGGQVEKATQRAKMMGWLADNGLDLDNTQAGTIDSYLDFDGQTITLAPNVRRGLELMRTLGRSSTAKYDTMQSWMCPDGRVRGGILYHGAATGRWSGKGVQPHNFPKGAVKDQDGLWALLMTLDRERIIADAPRDKKGEPLYTSVMEALSHGLRGVIIAGEGKQLYVADYAAIEARVLLWLANDQDALEIFRRGEDIYCWMASDIYGYPCNKNDHPDERALGKVAVLGLGYQMGASKFVDTCLAMAGITIDFDLAQRTVDAYRSKFYRVKEMWYQQEQAAIEAVLDDDSIIECGKVEWFTEGRFLYCRLPSGRCLAYPDPEVKDMMMPWGQRKACLTFMGINTYNHRWERQKTYGGMIVENQDQAIARDIMAEAMLRCERHPIYTPVLSVHDEAICEADAGQGDLQDFESLIAEVPTWGAGLPIAVEGFTCTRYRK
jgi:DNA polymerase